MTETFRNYAVGDTRYRRGQQRFTPEGFYDLSERLKGQFQAFATYLAYGPEFLAYVEQEEKREDGTVIKPAWSAKGWDGAAPASFVDFPIDFDASDDLTRAFEQCKAFVQRELLDKGIDTRYFVLYLSGGKGFHCHVSSSVLNVELPVANAGYRLKALATEWRKTYPTIDLSVYNSTSLFRLPGSKHKSSLHKTEIAWEDFTLEHLEKADEWASEPPAKIRVPEQGRPPVLLELPEVRRQQEAEYDYSAEIDFDPTALITPNCAWLKSVLLNPTADGDDGKGRDKRRNAVGILLSAHETPESNPELQWYLGQLFEHPYMDDFRRQDTMKWVREYDRDGEIKCKKTCYSLGCSAAQRKSCGTRSPLDWKLKRRKLEIMPVDVARAKNRETLSGILDEEGDDIYVLDWPVGIGKTYNLLKEVSGRGLTAFYVAQTHQLAVQTHENFLAEGLSSRHIASRSYLAEHDSFECVYPDEVDMAIRHGYGSHTVCGQCPRKRKVREEGGEPAPEDGNEACEYWDQFDGLAAVETVVGVHNHLFEFMYEQAAVADRSITVVDESPLEALAQTILPIESGLLETVRGALTTEIEDLERRARGETGPEEPVGTRRGLFARAARVLDAHMAASADLEAADRLVLVQAFSDIFAGRPFDTNLFANMNRDRLMACWHDAADRICERTGLGQGLEDRHRHLAVPFPVQTALVLAARNVVYDPTETHYLPIELPPNKVLVLDATASNDVYAPVVQYLTVGFTPRPYRFVEHPLVEQPFSRVTQITSSSNGVAKMADEAALGYLAHIVTGLMGQHPGRSLVVCHKAHAKAWRTALANCPDAEVATFGSLKGLNKWETCVAQYIIGTPFVPDHGIRELCAKLGQDIGLQALVDSAKLRRVMLLAKNGDTAVVSRRVYQGKPFHTAIAQMRSQWEVTQAVRLRLYDRHADDIQQLYIFSNVGLKGMYADRYVTTSELAWELEQAGQNIRSGQRADLEVKGVAYERITAWFDAQDKGHVFKTENIPPVSSDRYIRYWLMAAVNAGWVAKHGSKRGTRWEKLV